MKYLVSAVAALAFASFAAHAQEEETQEFVTKAAVSNKFEIASSELAMKRAESDAVRDFAKHMIEDHRKATKELQAAVAKTELGVGVRETLDEKHADMMRALGESTGSDFDQKYVEMQKAAHDEAVQVFESYAESKDASAPLRAFARKTLPVLKEHDRQIEQLGQGLTAGGR